MQKASIKPHSRRRTASFFLIPSVMAALLLNTACTPTVNTRGNLLQDYQIEEVKPGESTRADVLKALGSPTTKATFNDNVWYYIGQKTEKSGILDPKIKEEKIYTAVFNDDGILQDIYEDKNHRNDIPIARGKTPTYGNDSTVLQEFLGNLGRFNPDTGKD